MAYVVSFVSLECCRCLTQLQGWAQKCNGLLALPYTFHVVAPKKEKQEQESCNENCVAPTSFLDYDVIRRVFCFGLAA
jgi:hypothetical protein